MPRRKLLIIGIDGADHEIFLRLRERYSLFSSFSIEMMRTTLPPKTPSAWISSVTGVNPGKHGVFDFFLDVDLRSHRIRYASIHDARSKFLWEYLVENDVRVAIINFPFMYPPPRLEGGVFVGGMTVPQQARDFAYPQSLARELIDEGYIIDVGETVLTMVSLVRRNPMKFLGILRNMIISRVKAVKYILKSFDVDLLFVVFVALDRLLHWYMPKLHDLLNAKSVASLPKFEVELLRTIQLMDVAVREIRMLFSKYTGSKTPIIAYSDHGFKAVSKAVLPNSVLLKLGLAKLGQDEEETLLSQDIILGVAMKIPFLNELLNCIPTRVVKNVGWRIKPSQHFYEIFNLDDDSDVFYFSNYIWLNKNKYPYINIAFKTSKYKAIHSSIMRVANILDKYGVRIIPSKYVFKGPHVSKIPPYIVVADPDNDIMTLSLIPKGRLINTLDLNSTRDFIPSLSWRGDHSTRATLMTYRVLASKTVSIYDIMPSVLKYYGINIPSYIDGRTSINIM